MQKRHRFLLTCAYLPSRSNLPAAECRAVWIVTLSLFLNKLYMYVYIITHTHAQYIYIYMDICTQIYWNFNKPFGLYAHIFQQVH